MIVTLLAAQALARAARAEVEAALDAAGWPWSRRLSLWLDALPHPRGARGVTRTLLGTWSTPSGNSVDVFLLGSGRFLELACKWDEWPLRAADERFYVVEILPAVARRAREYLEIVASAVVVMS